MPWETSTMLSTKSNFILKVKSKEESLSAICRSYNISRTTGYKWIKRFDKQGIKGLEEYSRRPKSKSLEVPHEVTVKIVAYRQSHPSWGATKIRKLLQREFRKVPSRRTIHRILQDCNLVSTRKMRKRKNIGQRLVLKSRYSNHVWTTDFKGWWRTKDGKKVFPLTIRDEYSKFILAIEVLPSPSLDLVKQSFIQCFQRYGMPEYIRCDNGSPFAFSRSFCGLSRLSAWWLKLGIIPNFIPLASPQYNAGHERMHLDMAKDLEATPARNISQQQLVSEGWREEFNNIRPHAALDDKTPSEVYKRCRTKYNIAEHRLEYSSNMLVRFVNMQGQFKYAGKRIFISKAFAGENIGLEFTDNNMVNIYFANACVGFSDAYFSTPIVEYDLVSDNSIALAA